MKNENPEKKFSHVVVIGVDGAGAFIKNAETPEFDRIFKDGAVTYEALSSRPSISAECWGSMLLGVGPEVHKLTNGILENTTYPIDSEFPSLFRRIKEKYPEAELGSFCDWNPITHGIVENNLGVKHDTADDTTLTPIVCDYIRQNKPTFLFVHFDSVDGRGHKFGYGTQPYMLRISEVDKLINDIHKALKDTQMIDDTLFIVIADHGGTNPVTGGGSHGGWTDEEKYVTFAAAGKGVNKTYIKEMNIRDLSAIVLYAFGIETPDFDENGWTSQIPQGLFDDENIKPYRDISHLTGASPRISKIPHTSELI